jgi:hypothetical protein
MRYLVKLDFVYNSFAAGTLRGLPFDDESRKPEESEIGSNTGRRCYAGVSLASREALIGVQEASLKWAQT